MERQYGAAQGPPVEVLTIYKPAFELLPVSL